MTLPQDPRVRRNIIIFYVGTMLLAIAGGLLMPITQDGGSLLFVLSPLLMVLVVRILLRDGWKDAGLRLEFKRNWRWYVFALLMFPVLFLVVISINVVLGWASLAMTVAEAIPLLLVGLLTQLLPRLLFALSEEWAWRGYLEPRLALLGTPALRRHITVGMVWGIWHFPLILTTDYTSAPIGLFLVLFMVGILFMAVIYGRMRRSSGSVWPAVLMHGIGNAAAFAILGGKLITYDHELLGGIQTGSLTVLAVLGVVALLVWHRRD